MISNAYTTGRLTIVDPATASKPVADVLKSIPTINVFRALANATTLFPAYMEYVKLLFGPMELDATLERMIVLQVAKFSKCSYVWRQNVIVATSVGVSQRQIDALEIGDTESSVFSEKEKAALRFADEVVQLIEVTDATYTNVKSFFSDRVITELLYVIGTYMFLARLLRTGRVPLDERPADAPHPPQSK